VGLRGGELRRHAPQADQRVQEVLDRDLVRPRDPGQVDPPVPDDELGRVALEAGDDGGGQVSYWHFFTWRINICQ